MPNLGVISYSLKSLGLKCLTKMLITKVNRIEQTLFRALPVYEVWQVFTLNVHLQIINKSWVKLHLSYLSY